MHDPRSSEYGARRLVVRQGLEDLKQQRLQCLGIHVICAHHRANHRISDDRIYSLATSFSAHAPPDAGCRFRVTCMPRFHGDQCPAGAGPPNFTLRSVSASGIAASEISIRTQNASM